MLKHSIKVCRLYKVAASITKEVKEKGGSIKDLVYQKKHPNVKALYALVSETLRKNVLLDEIINTTQILIKEPRFDPWLARILITELLWGKKRLSGEAKPIQTVLSYQNELIDCLKNISNRLEISDNKVSKPRYVRINTLMMTSSDAVNGFMDEGWQFIKSSHDDYDQYLSAVSSLKDGQFMTDIHVPELLAFPSSAQFYKHFCYLDGSIILQDKASCLPALLLNPKPGCNILDMCSAPGMKTTQLAAMMNNQGILFAAEMDTRRYQTLCKMVETAKASCVKPINKDVLTLTSKDCPNVEYILVDPSCSGSGMVDRINFNSEEQYNRTRLRKLSTFQVKVLRHALTNFPNVKRVVYSTCSTFPQENEEVVEYVLRMCNNFKLVNCKKLLNDKWKNTGSTKYIGVGENCLYAYPNSDLTNGFFMAVLEKNTDAEVTNNSTLKRKNDVDENIEKKKKKIKIEDLENEYQELAENQQQKYFILSDGTSLKNTFDTNASTSKVKYESTECQQEVGDKLEISNEVSDVSPQKVKKNKKKCTDELAEQIEEICVEEAPIKKSKKRHKL